MSRSRSDLGLITRPENCHLIQNYNYQTGAKTTLTNYGVHVNAKSGKSRWCTDEVTPNYRARQRAGEVIINNCTLSSLERIPVRVTVRNGPHPYLGLCDITGDFSAYMETHTGIWWNDNFPEKSTLSSLVVTQAHARVDTQTLNGLELVKDLDSTLGMLRRPLSSAAQLVTRMGKSYKRKMKRKSMTSAKATADTWLEYRYGWTPLVLDTEAIIEECHDHYRRSDYKRLVARASKRVERSRSCEIIVPLGSAPPGIDTMVGTLNVKADLSVSAGVVYAVNARTAVEHLNTVVGVRPNDLVGNIYECLPYSFVVDWFVNVGDWLRAVTPNPYVEKLGSWLTVCENQVRTHDNIRTSTYTPSPATYYKHTVQGSTVISRSFTRTANPPIPRTPVRNTLPLGVMRNLDAASLILQTVKTGFKTWNR